jgi:hypothetical protein
MAMLVPRSPRSRSKANESFLKLIGHAVQEYARVERIQSTLFKEILGVDSIQASIIFFTVQNVRSRNELFGSLLTHRYGDTHDRYWDSCSKFLEKLSIFRNAIVHWHPRTAGPGIQNPMPGRSGRSLVASDLPPFIFDCQCIYEELRQFVEFLTERPADDDSTSSQRFLEPIPYRNRADLQPPPKPKVRKHRPRSSQALP